MSVIDRQKHREGSAYATFAHQRQSNGLKRVVFWTVCLLVSVAFWVWLLQPIFAETQDNKKAKAEALMGVLQNLAAESLKRKAKEAPASEVEKRKTKAAEALSGAIQKATKEQRPTASFVKIDKLRQHIAKCWNIPRKELVDKFNKIEVLVNLDPDGYVTKAEVQINQDKMKEDPLFQEMAEATKAAILDCQPLPLPKEKYELWKSFIFVFDIKSM